MAERGDENRSSAEQALADQIEEDFLDAITGTESDPASLAQHASLAMRLGVAGLASTAQGAIARIEEIIERKRASEEIFAADPREETKRADRKDREEEMLRDFRQDARQQQQQAEQAASARREQILRDAENDNTPSSDYPGLTRGDVLRGLRIINENLSFYSARAVERGLIKPEERLAFEEYMRQKYWLEQQRALQRAGQPNELDTPEGRERQRRIEEMERKNPNFVKAERESVDATARRTGMTQDATATIANDARRVSSRFDVFTDEDAARMTARSDVLTRADWDNIQLLPESNQSSNEKDLIRSEATISAAGEIEGGISAERISANFNAAASNTAQAAPAALAPVQAQAAARQMGFDTGPSI